MKRDMGLIRQVLLETEEMASIQIKDVDMGEKWANKDMRNVVHHLEFAKEMGLLDSDPEGSDKFHITPKGHEFLAMFRDDELWEHLTGRLAELGVGPSHEILVEVVKRVAVGQIDATARGPRARDEDRCRIRDLEQQADKNERNYKTLQGFVAKADKAAAAQCQLIEDLRKKIQTLKQEGANDEA